MYDDDLDNLIDQAVSSYGAEPPAGLEAKIIAEVRSTPMLMKKGAHAKWVRVASGIAAGGLVAALLLHLERTQTSPFENRMTAAQKAHALPAIPIAVESHTHARVAVKVVSIRVPGLRSTYHQPALTEQELLLASLAAEHPKQALEWNETKQKKSEPLAVAPLSGSPMGTEPVELEAIVIAPLPSNAVD